MNLNLVADNIGKNRNRLGGGESIEINRKILEIRKQKAGVFLQSCLVGQEDIERALCRMIMEEKK